MARRSDKRGFASMDPERRRRFASEGGRVARGGRGRDYDDEYDVDYDEDYDEDEGHRVSNRYGDENWDAGYEDDDEYQDTGYGDEDEYEEEEDDRRGRRRYSSGNMGRSGRQSSSSRRGFAGMDPEDQRRIARMGGEATARSHGRDFYEEIGHEGGEAVRHEYGPEFYSRIGRLGGRARWEEDDYDYDRGRRRSSHGRSSSGQSRRSSYPGRSTGSGRRGFGAMPREEVRRIARMGGRARWGEDDRERGRGNRSRSRGR